MFSVATMPVYNVGSDALGGSWNQHQPFVSSPLSSSPIRASSPSSPLSERSTNMVHRETQSSPIQSSTFNKFSRYANQTPVRTALVRQRNSRDREMRRKNFLEQVRQRADERTYQRRDMEGTLMKSSWDRDMRERELQKQMEGDAFFSEADIDDAAELLLEQERQQAEQASAIGQSTQMGGADQDTMLDEMVQQEERELDEMLMAYEEPREHQQGNAQRPSSPTFGDDDDDYDALFMELVSQEARPEDHTMDML